MFEAKYEPVSVIKKVLDAIKDLVNDANFDCGIHGMKLQAMDSSHVALVALELGKKGFDDYRCDRAQSLGISLKNMAQILKCAANDDTMTMKAEDQGDTITFMCESKDGERMSAFELKLLDIDSENLGIPQTDYQSEVTMSAAEFQRICRDLTAFGDTVKIMVSKEAISFSADGDIGSGSITVKATNEGNVDDAGGSNKKKRKAAAATKKEKKEKKEKKVKSEDDDEEEEEEEEDIKDEDLEEGAGQPPKKKLKKRSRAEMEDEDDADDDDAANDDDDDDDDEDARPVASKNAVTIRCGGKVELTFALKYLNSFAKAASLSDTVKLSLSPDLPIVVDYKIENLGKLNYYLAPKISEEE